MKKSFERVFSLSVILLAFAITLNINSCKSYADYFDEPISFLNGMTLNEFYQGWEGGSSGEHYASRFRVQPDGNTLNEIWGTGVYQGEGSYSGTGNSIVVIKGNYTTIGEEAFKDRKDIISISLKV